jgi:hypothetical protein
VHTHLTSVSPHRHHTHTRLTAMLKARDHRHTCVSLIISHCVTCVCTHVVVGGSCPVRFNTPHSQPNKWPYDTSLSVIRHKKPLKVRLSRRLNASTQQLTGRGVCSPHRSASCTPPTNLGLVGARTARHVDREPGGPQFRVSTPDPPPRRGGRPYRERDEGGGGARGGAAQRSVFSVYGVYDARINVCDQAPTKST